MHISHFGGIIAAANKELSVPLMQVGEISIIRRIVISYQQAGIFPIVVVISPEETAVQKLLSEYGVICLVNDREDSTELMSSVRIGLSFLAGKCDHIVFTPVNVPMFTLMSLKKLMDTDGLVVAPSYEHRGGHPLIIDEKCVPDILNYQGNEGLKGAFASAGIERVWVEVNDPGVLTTVKDEKQLHSMLSMHNENILRPVLHLQLEKENAFFDHRAKLLLFLIEDTQNMQLSCQYSGMSYSKAWKVLKDLEDNLGYPVVERQHGGKNGGGTKLTEKGRYFLLSYQRFEDEIHSTMQDKFFKILMNRM